MCDFLARIRRCLHSTRSFKRNQYRKFSSLELLETRQLLAADFQLVKDLNVQPVPANSDEYDSVMIGSTAYFLADDGMTGAELWKSDGTAAGTVLVKDIRSGGNGSNPRELTNVNGTLYFAADDRPNGRELWKSDGTTAGTVLVKDIRSGVNDSDPRYLTNVNGTLYFTANDGELWKTNGSASGTLMINGIPNNNGFGEFIH